MNRLVWYHMLDHSGNHVESGYVPCVEQEYLRCGAKKKYFEIDWALRIGKLIVRSVFGSGKTWLIDSDLCGGVGFPNHDVPQNELGAIQVIPL